MTYDLKLADDGDLALDAMGQAAIIGGAQQIAQQIRLTLLIFLGEWFLDTDFGTPWFERVLGKGHEDAEIESVIRQQVRAVPGVAAVGAIALTRSRASRGLSVTIRDVVTDEGLVPEVTVFIVR